MIKDFFRLVQNKMKHYAILPSIRSLVHTPAFQNALFLLGILAFLQACLMLAPESVTASSSNVVNGIELPVCSVQTPQKKVALSFDCAFGYTDTQKILDTLREKNVHATFFVTGSWVRSYPDAVKDILAAGHDLGSYGESYTSMSALSVPQKQAELENLHRRVKELTGYEMNLFRLPYGDYDNETIRTIREYGYFPVQWTVNSMDWKDYGTEDIVSRVLDSSRLKNGAIILCHNGARCTPDALSPMIEGLQDKGYQVVPVSDLILQSDYHMDADGTQIPNERSGRK